ncbi:PspC domain-containing protein [Bacillus spongiae]|uniref:PspC domain-containing protein n=1 Tax=Bacillus spongiae TaxID=2683610 RepID=A0ABU8HK59_9BACI
METKLTKSNTDKAIFGVCGGMANYFGVPSTLVRIIFIFLPMFVLFYLLLNYFLPEDNSLYKYLSYSLLNNHDSFIVSSRENI